MGKPPIPHSTHDPSKYRPVSNSDGPSGSLTAEPSLTIRFGGGYFREHEIERKGGFGNPYSLSDRKQDGKGLAE